MTGVACRVEEGLRRGRGKGITTSFYDRLAQSKGIKPQFSSNPSGSLRPLRTRRARIGRKGTKECSHVSRADVLLSRVLWPFTTDLDVSRIYYPVDDIRRTRIYTLGINEREGDCVDPKEAAFLCSITRNFSQSTSSLALETGRCAPQNPFRSLS